MFKRIKRTSLILGITLTVILGMSYGTFIFTTNSYSCLLYTSDAADE